MKFTRLISALSPLLWAFEAHGQQPAPTPTPPIQLLPWAATNHPSSGEQTDINQAASMLTAAFQALQGGTNSPLQSLGAGQPVDFRKLREWLPANLAGLDRTEDMGEKNGAFGFAVTRAEGEYGQPAQASIKVSVTDLAAMGPMAAMASLGWSTAEIDRESSSGYERTTTIQGNRVLLKFDNKTRSGSAKLMVGGRFLVEIEGQNISPTQLPETLQALDFNALQSLAKTSITP